MQEGTSSLMQMAKVAVAVEALRQAGLPFVAGNIADRNNPIHMTQHLSIKCIINFYHPSFLRSAE